MNVPQTLGALRTVLAFGLGIAAARGWLQADQIGPLLDAVMGVVASVAALGTLGWSIRSHTHDNVRKEAVAAIKADPSVEGNRPLMAALANAGADIRSADMPATKAEATEPPTLGGR